MENSRSPLGPTLLVPAIIALAIGLPGLAAEADAPIESALNASCNCKTDLAKDTETAAVLRVEIRRVGNKF